MARPVPDGSQEQLFVTSTRIDEARSLALGPDAPEDVRTQVERDIHRINALDGMSRANEALGFVAASGTQTHRPRLQDRYPQLDQVSDAMLAKAQGFGKFVWWSFAKSIGFFDSEITDESRLELRRQFDEFRKTYDGSGLAQERNRKIDELREGIERTIEEYSEGRRKQASQRRELGIPDVESEDGKLARPERMLAIFEDPRAGFIPTNNTEITMSLAFLDYMDNPDYDYGIVNQFDEIFMRKERENREAGKVRPRGESGVEAVVSITHAIADMYENATAQINHLQELQQVLQQPFSPKLTVLDLINQGDIDMTLKGFAPLVRFMDQRELMRAATTRVQGFSMSPTAAVRNETAPRRPGANKIVEDRYTGTATRPDFAKRIRQQAYKLSLIDARVAVNEAINSEINRRYFMESRLRTLRRDPRASVRDVAITSLVTLQAAA